MSEKKTIEINVNELSKGVQKMNMKEAIERHSDVYHEYNDAKIHEGRP